MPGDAHTAPLLLLSPLFPRHYLFYMMLWGSKPFSFSLSTSRRKEAQRCLYNNLQLADWQDVNKDLHRLTKLRQMI